MSDIDNLTNKIYNESCLDTMKKMPDESVDFIVTSPPYGVGKEYESFNDGFNQIKGLLDDVVEEFKRILVEDGRMAINFPYAIKDEGDDVKAIIPYFMSLCEGLDFNLREWITWVKSIKNPSTSTAWGSWRSPSNPHLCNGMVSEAIMVYNKNGWKKNGQGKESDLGRDEFMHWTNNTWLITPDRKKEHHPAPFPLDIPYRLIKLYTYVGDVVYDPFMGSGTTAIACKKTDRDWIGSEISSDYIETAIERIENCNHDDNLDTVTLENGNDDSSKDKKIHIEDLDIVDGIGEKTLERIRQERQKISLDELEDVNGIGDKTIERIGNELVESWKSFSDENGVKLSKGDTVRMDTEEIDKVEEVFERDNLLKVEENGYLGFSEIKEVKFNE